MRLVAAMSDAVYKRRHGSTACTRSWIRKNAACVGKQVTKHRVLHIGTGEWLAVVTLHRLIPRLRRTGCELVHTYVRAMLVGPADAPCPMPSDMGVCDRESDVDSMRIVGEIRGTLLSGFPAPFCLSPDNRGQCTDEKKKGDVARRPLSLWPRRKSCSSSPTCSVALRPRRNRNARRHPKRRHKLRKRHQKRQMRRPPPPVMVRRPPS